MLGLSFTPQTPEPAEEVPEEEEAEVNWELDLQMSFLAVGNIWSLLTEQEASPSCGWLIQGAEMGTVPQKEREGWVFAGGFAGGRAGLLGAGPAA